MTRRLLRKQGEYFLDCICSDHADNLYKCIRKISVGTDGLYTSNYAFCKFQKDGTNSMGAPFYEAYDIATDPYQTKNLYVSGDISDTEMAYYEQRIAKLEYCAGNVACAWFVHDESNIYSITSMFSCLGILVRSAFYMRTYMYHWQLCILYVSEG